MEHIKMPDINWNYQNGATTEKVQMLINIGSVYTYSIHEKFTIDKPVSQSDHFFPDA